MLRSEVRAGPRLAVPPGGLQPRGLQLRAEALPRAQGRIGREGKGLGMVHGDVVLRRVPICVLFR